MGLALVTRSRLLDDKVNKTNDFGINNVVLFENYTKNMCLSTDYTRYGITHFDSLHSKKYCTTKIHISTYTNDGNGVRACGFVCVCAFACECLMLSDSLQCVCVCVCVTVYVQVVH